MHSIAKVACLQIWPPFLRVDKEKGIAQPFTVPQTRNLLMLPCSIALRLSAAIGCNSCALYACHW